MKTGVGEDERRSLCLSCAGDEMMPLDGLQRQFVSVLDVGASDWKDLHHRH